MSALDEYEARNLTADPRSMQNRFYICSNIESIQSDVRFSRREKFGESSLLP
jgi:hypothetical protein